MTAEPKRFRTIEIDGHIFYASVPAFEFEQTDTGWIITAKSRIYHNVKHDEEFEALIHKLYTEDDEAENEQ